MLDPERQFRIHTAQTINVQQCSFEKMFAMWKINKEKVHVVVRDYVCNMAKALLEFSVLRTEDVYISKVAPWPRCNAAV